MKKHSSTRILAKTLIIPSLAAVAILLSSCNLGSSSANDVQTGPGSTSSGNSTFTISSYTTTGCRTISQNGTCTVLLNGYTGTGNYNGESLTVQSIPGYNYSVPSGCNASGVVSKSCTITITSTGSVSTAQAINVYLSGQTNSGSIPVGNIGGGISN